MNAAGDIVSEENLIFYGLNRLLTDFNPFKSGIQTRNIPIDFAELAVLLEVNELNLKGITEFVPY